MRSLLMVMVFVASISGAAEKQQPSNPLSAAGNFRAATFTTTFLSL